MLHGVNLIAVNNRKIALTIVALCVSFLLQACNSELLKTLDYSISPTQESVQVELNFTKLFNSNLTGNLNVKDYGNIFLTPAKKRIPFKIGFDLNPQIFSDPDILKLKTTTTLPTGKPLPNTINRALVKVPLESYNIDYSVFLYADTYGKEWAGVVILFNDFQSKHLPRDYYVTQNYFKDSNGTFKASVVVFGPSYFNKMSVEMPAGIAIFANLAALMKLEDKSGSDTGLRHIAEIIKNLNQFESSN